MDLRGHVTNESWCRLKVTEKCAFATSTRVGGWRTPRGAAKIRLFFGCHEMLDLKAVIARFGAEAKAKLANPGATGEPEDQLRAPLEGLFADLGELCGFRREWLVAVGESSLSTLKTRPDYAITLRNVLVGFVEVKAPGKGADPRRYKAHDKEQWEKLQSLPNLLYTDGNSFSLWQEGELVGSIVELQGDVETSGAKLAAPPELFARFD